MKVMLRHKGTRRYHAGWNSWCELPKAATDFGSMDRATQRARDEGLQNVEMVLLYDESMPEEVIQLPPRPIG